MPSNPGCAKDKNPRILGYCPGCDTVILLLSGSNLCAECFGEYARQGKPVNDCHHSMALVDPEHEARIAAYTARADARAPLFDPPLPTSLRTEADEDQLRVFVAGALAGWGEGGEEPEID